MRAFTWVILIVIVLFLVAVLDFVPVILAWELAAGWLGYLGRVVPQVRLSWGAIGMAVLCVIGMLLLGHSLARWLWRETRPTELRGSSRWRVGWTLATASVVVLMFVSGVAAVGITHQTAWLMKSEQRMFRYGGRSRESAQRVMCGSNLRQIGQAIEMYLKEHGGRYPDSLAEILRTQDLTSEVFVCPASHVEKAQGTTAEEQARTLNDHCSYVYHGRGLVVPVAADRPVACEPLANHNGLGMNILFGDGHVEFFTADQAKKVMDRLTP